MTASVTESRGDRQSASGPADRGRSGDGGRAVPLAIAAAIAILTLAVYARVAGYPFVAYDDDLSVTQNPHVVAGLSAEGAAWAFTTTSAANWHPLTWLSHMADVSLFGVNPGAHHAVNVVIHAANALLLFFLICGGRSFMRRPGRRHPAASRRILPGGRCRLSLSGAGLRPDVLYNGEFVETTGAETGSRQE